MRFVAAIVLTSALLFAQSARINSVDPLTAKSGDTITASGENLDKAHVRDLYLTDGKNDIKLVILEQSATTLKFKVPAAAKGRLALMITTAGNNPQMIEQPVKLTIE
ncbi:MAG: IPT/TIG domain-containing protein [Bryobacteraceae bacterium]|nr:IPT/TIG domain-containing protein [Bryobacteraceae bacterium]